MDIHCYLTGERKWSGRAATNRVRRQWTFRADPQPHNKAQGFCGPISSPQLPFPQNSSLPRHQQVFSLREMALLLLHQQ